MVKEPAPVAKQGLDTVPTLCDLALVHTHHPCYRPNAWFSPSRRLCSLVSGHSDAGLGLPTKILFTAPWAPL
jgi:hypothetical protein